MGSLRRVQKTIQGYSVLEDGLFSGELRLNMYLKVGMYRHTISSEAGPGSR